MKITRYLGWLLVLAIIGLTAFYAISSHKARAQGAVVNFTQLLSQAVIFPNERLVWISSQPPAEDESAVLWAAFRVGQVRSLEGAIPTVEQFLRTIPPQHGRRRSTAF